jgi:hypothetical protein
LLSLRIIIIWRSRVQLAKPASSPASGQAELRSPEYCGQSFGVRIEEKTKTRIGRELILSLLGRSERWFSSFGDGKIPQAQGEVPTKGGEAESAVCGRLLQNYTCEDTVKAVSPDSPQRSNGH